MIRWGVCFRIRLRPSLCGCGSPSAVIALGRVAGVCGCGTPASILPPHVSTSICGCGLAGVSIVPRWVFHVCGCATQHSSMGEGVRVKACGCGSPSSRVARLIRSTACGCGKPSATEDTDVIPPGVIVPFGGTTPPAGWLVCDGSFVSQTTYAALYAAIGDAWKLGIPGAGNFQLPDLRQVMLRGFNPGSSSPDQIVGGLGGNDNQTLTVANLPAHTHGLGFNVGVNNAGGTLYYVTPATTTPVSQQSQSTGNGTAFDNRPFFKVVQHIIKT